MARHLIQRALLWFKFRTVIHFLYCVLNRRVNFSGNTGNNTKQRTLNMKRKKSAKERILTNKLLLIRLKSNTLNKELKKIFIWQESDTFSWSFFCNIKNFSLNMTKKTDFKVTQKKTRRFFVKKWSRHSSCSKAHFHYFWEI